MNLIPWKSKRQAGFDDDPWVGAPLARLRSEMDRMFERFWGADWGLLPEGFGAWPAWAPNVDVSETDDAVVVRAELPGVDPKNLDISVREEMLSIAGEKTETKENKGENFYRSERRFGSFRRHIALPASVDTNAVTAEHKNGVLLITLKKKPGAVAKRIAVKSAD